jgi:hypothetical protein
MPTRLSFSTPNKIAFVPKLPRMLI